MLKPLTRHQQQALLYLKQSAFWTEIEGLIKQELAQIQDSLVEAGDDLTLRRYQGRARAWRDFLDEVNNAPANIDKVSGRSRT